MATKYASPDVAGSAATDDATGSPSLVPPRAATGAERPRRDPSLVPVVDRARWNTLVHSMPHAFLTQTWEWGEVSANRGWEVHRLVLATGPGDPGASGAIQVLVKRLPLVGWGIGYAPRGPLHAPGSDAGRALSVALRSWGREHHVATVVVDPAVDAASPLGRSLTEEPWREAAAVGEGRVHVLDLSPDVEPWGQLRPKHRQWIRRAERAGIQVAWTDPSATDDDAERAFQRFHAVYDEVAARLGLVQDRSLLRHVWQTFRQAGLAYIAIATQGGVPLAALLVIVSGDEMVGFAGGQGSAGASTGAGKLVQWRAIHRARELGLRRYNTWGTATGSLAHYKEGFGAREESYVGTRALAISAIPDRLVRLAWSAQRGVRRARTVFRKVRARSTPGATGPEA